MIIGYLDRPADGDVINAGVSIVGGWAADATGAVGVDLDLDGATIARARLGFERADVAAAVSPNLLLSGWMAFVDLYSLMRDGVSHRLDAWAIGDAGNRVHIGTATLRRAVTAPGDRIAVEIARRPRRAPAHRDRVRILAVTHNLDRGGSQLILLERLRDLVRQGATATVVSPTDGPLRAQYESAGLTCRVSAAPLFPATERDYEAALARLASWASDDFDLVVANTTASAPAIDHASRLGLPALWLVYEWPISPAHLSAHISMHLPPYAAARTAACLRAGATLVFDAGSTSGAFAAWAPSSRRVVIPGAIDLAAIGRFRQTFDRAAARRAIGLSAGAPLIVMLGTLLHQKGAPAAIQAFARIAGAFPDAHFAIVGSRGDHLTQAVAAYAAASNIAPRVHIEPMGDDAYRWLGMADVFVCASDLESMPRVVMEAMAFDVPVISTPVADVPTMIADGETGWLTPAGDPLALAETLRRVLTIDAATRSRVVAAARHRVQARDAPIASAAFAALIDETLAVAAKNDR